MLEQSFAEIYTKFKMSLYSKVFRQLSGKEEGLSAVEVFCVEVIYALGRPTINEFASFARISPPNAAYKINNLVRKGYVIKQQSDDDKREYHLDVTEKYMNDYGITYDYMNVVMKRIRQRFSQEEVAQLEHVLKVISEELMLEVPLNRKFDETVFPK
ncbi:MAG: MarR family transcriptional regulator [Firmicutes bacterium]|nr:MarR family transcriptional regulator [Bacillota bacterium]